MGISGNAGRTVADLVREALAASGAEEAAGVEVTYKSGAKHQILSDDNLLLKDPANLVASVAIKQSAQAGLSV